MTAATPLLPMAKAWLWKNYSMICFRSDAPAFRQLEHREVVTDDRLIDPHLNLDHCLGRRREVYRNQVLFPLCSD